MGRYSLIVLLGVLLGCSTHQSSNTPQPSPTYFESDLTPYELFTLAKFHLEAKGYPVELEVKDRGLIVTRWIPQSPSEQTQITVKVSNHPFGSVLSSHIVRRRRNQGRWISVPSDSYLEAALIKELREKARTAQDTAQGTATDR